MIALNELVSNKNQFINKYKILNKHFDIEKICKKEEIFSKLNKEANQLRSKCNQQCDNISNLINSNQDTTKHLIEINKLDKQILKLEKKSKKLYNSINKQLKKLPNLTIKDNVCDIEHKTINNKNFTFKDFKNSIINLCKTTEQTKSIKYYLKTIQNYVIDNINLPMVVECENSFLILCENSINFSNLIFNIMSDNSKNLIEKSIKNLSKHSCYTLISTLCDETNILIENSGEYLSRDFNIKYKNKNNEMTKFVQTILVKLNKIKN